MAQNLMSVAGSAAICARACAAAASSALALCALFDWLDTAFKLPVCTVGVASGIYKMGSSLGGAMGIAVTASLFALFLPLGMASAAQYALWFNAAMCLGATVVSALMLPCRSHS